MVLYLIFYNNKRPIKMIIKVLIKYNNFFIINIKIY